MQLKRLTDREHQTIQLFFSCIARLDLTGQQHLEIQSSKMFQRNKISYANIQKYFFF